MIIIHRSNYYRDQFREFLILHCLLSCFPLGAFCLMEFSYALNMGSSFHSLSVSSLVFDHSSSSYRWYHQLKNLGPCCHLMRSSWFLHLETLMAFVLRSRWRCWSCGERLMGCSDVMLPCQFRVNLIACLSFTEDRWYCLDLMHWYYSHVLNSELLVHYCYHWRGFYCSSNSSLDSRSILDSVPVPLVVEDDY